MLHARQHNYARSTELGLRVLLSPTETDPSYTDLIGKNGNVLREAMCLVIKYILRPGNKLKIQACRWVQVHERTLDTQVTGNSCAPFTQRTGKEGMKFKLQQAGVTGIKRQK